MYTQFPLLASHLEAAHELWKKIVKSNDIVIDATCGNGHDTVLLAQLTPQGKTYALDIQEAAIALTRQKLHQENLLERVHLFCQSHHFFPKEILPLSVQLIVYNLGYLPGGNKQLTTQTSTTLQSVQTALTLLKPGGVLCLTLYPGHSEGFKEQAALLEFSASLAPADWMVCHMLWHNRKASPNLLTFIKSDKYIDKYDFLN